MEQEFFISGYCRVADRSRLVAALLEDGRLTEVDCAYGSCIYQTSCPIGQQLAGAEK